MIRYGGSSQNLMGIKSLNRLFPPPFLSCPPADLARALIPRSVTVALALPIATQLDAPLSITAAAVLLQGALRAVSCGLRHTRLRTGCMHGYWGTHMRGRVRVRLR